LASLASIRASTEASAGGVPVGGADCEAGAVGGDLGFENDDVYACNQSADPDAGNERGEGHREEEEEEMGGRDFDTSDLKRTAAVVDATAAKWAEIKTRQPSHTAEYSKGTGEDERQDEDWAGDAKSAEGTEGEGGEDEALAASVNSSLGSSLGSKSRGGRLGMLSVSLDASGALQLPDTPQIPSGSSGHGDTGVLGNCLGGDDDQARDTTDGKSGAPSGVVANAAARAAARPDTASFGAGMEEEDGASSLASSMSSMGSSMERRARKGRLAMLEVGSPSVPLLSADFFLYVFPCAGVGITCVA